MTDRSMYHSLVGTNVTLERKGTRTLVTLPLFYFQVPSFNMKLQELLDIEHLATLIAGVFHLSCVLSIHVAIQGPS